ncbi:beta-N-acetylhexosaminidase [Sphingosinicella sp. YJ22]|uniref:beta-N-acetylhexosaminidase n=1 Tax=Sphingosinicella sp. YJ22 TaxID=1104780 RepID=UPI00140C3A5F|nr:beta-N-acetylhexosaminidase [Sphingosinicella sp. YJ22]
MLPAILGLSGLTLTDDERALFRAAQPAGFILFGRNVADPEQLRALTDALRAAAGRDDLLIMVDQEGGPVARLRPPHWPEFPAGARIGALYETAPISGMEAARVNALAMALVLRAAGINVTTLPLLDLRHDGAHPVIGERAFGADPLLVAALGRTVLDGLGEGGVAGVIKHLPGHGRADSDSHVALPVVDAAEEELAADLLPFQGLSGRARIGMAAHILYTAWDAERAASVSPVVVDQVIRGRIGFAGLLVSDDVAMHALTGSVEERAAAVLAAGCDLALCCSGDFAESARLAEALPPLREESAGRLARAVPSAAQPEADIAELIAKRDALLAHVRPSY